MDVSWRRPLWLSLSLFWATILTGQSWASATGARRPHVILLLADDLGWANVGYHRPAGFKETATPRIDELVAEGLELTRHYVG